MRTTLAIDDDVLEQAKAIARLQGRSLGEVVSELMRSALRSPRHPATRNGVPLLNSGAQPALVTLEIVKALRDEGAA